MSLDPRTLDAFAAEIVKQASRLSSIGALLGPGAALGAAAGGLGGAVHGYRKAKEQGSSGVMGGLGGALSGAQTGALVGGTAGIAAGALRPQLGKALIERAGDKDGALGALTRFGQRQVHAVTGHGDINALRGGSYSAKKELDRLVGSGADPKKIQMAKETYDAAQRGVERGLTNLPGIGKALVKDPIGTLRDTAKTHYAGASPAAKAMTAAGVGLGAYDAYSKYREGDSPGAAGSAAGSLAGLALSPVLPAVTSMAVGGLASKATHKAVGGLKKLHERGLAIHPSESVDTQPAPEMHRSPSASGLPNYDAGSA